VAEGKLQEGWVHADMLGMLQQLGVIPPVPDAPLPVLNRSGEDFLWGESLEVTGDPGDPEANKAIVRRETEEIWNQGKLDLIDEMYTTNLVNHDATWPGVRDFESYKEWVATMGRPPGLYITIDDMIGEGDKVAARWTGTFTESASGVDATLTGIILYRFVDGKIVEMWWAKDFLGLVQQLPPPTAVESRTWGQIKSLFQD
jgi:predicted ester cyclase